MLMRNSSQQRDNVPPTANRSFALNKMSFDSTVVSKGFVIPASDVHQTSQKDQSRSEIGNRMRPGSTCISSAGEVNSSMVTLARQPVNQSLIEYANNKPGPHNMAARRSISRLHAYH